MSQPLLEYLPRQPCYQYNHAQLLRQRLQARHVLDHACYEVDMTLERARCAHQQVCCCIRWCTSGAQVHTAAQFYRDKVNMQCHAVLCRAVPHCAVLCCAAQAVPCRAVPCRAVPCRAVPCRAVPCRAVPCRAVPCRAGTLGQNDVAY